MVGFGVDGHIYGARVLHNCFNRDIKCSIRTLRYSTNYDVIATAVVRHFSGLVLLVTTLIPHPYYIHILI